MTNIFNQYKITLLLLVSAFVFISSYIIFQDYQPKSLKELSEVRGVDSSRFLQIPFPLGASDINHVQKTNGYEVSFFTKRSLSDIEKFYVNIFAEISWELEKRESGNSSLIIEYKNKEQRATINVSVYDSTVNFVTIQVVFK